MNPYQSPTAPSAAPVRTTSFSIGRALRTVLAATVLVSAFGGLLGLGIGYFIPDYYRSLIRVGRQAGFDPVSFGLGQGLTQGAAGGILVGLAIVAIAAWHEARSARNSAGGRST